MTDPFAIDAAALRRLAATRFFSAPLDAAGRGDGDLNPGSGLDFSVEAVPAAVLVPIVARPAGLTVLFTERTDHLASHPGQVAFPGGKIDAGDAGPLAAALREAAEEIGLDGRYIDPIGYLDTYQTGSGFRIVPAVALIAEGFTLRLNAREVAAAFEVPLAFLLDPGNHQLQSREWRGKLRHYYEMPYDGHRIWGVTAGIVRNLHDRLVGP